MNDGMTSQEVLFKHQMSEVQDALTRYEINWSRKTVRITQATFQGAQFVSTSLLERLLFEWIPSETKDAVRPFNDDNTNSWKPQRSDWRVLVSVGDVHLRVEAWNQRPIGGSGPQRCLELFPVLPDEALAESDT